MDYIKLKKLKRSVEHIEGEIEEIEAKLTNISPVLSDMPRGGGSGTDVDILLERKHKLEQELKPKKEQYLNAIKSMPQTAESKYIKLKLFRGLNWYQIATKLEGSPSEHEKIRKRVERFRW